MASHFTNAETAIEFVIAKKYPESSGQWGDIVPKTHWKMDLGTWNAMLADILEKFDSLSVLCRAAALSRFDGSRSKTLSILQQLIAETAICPKVKAAKK